MRTKRANRSGPVPFLQHALDRQKAGRASGFLSKGRLQGQSRVEPGRPQRGRIVAPDAKRAFPLYHALLVLVPKYVPQRKAFIACLTLALLFLAGALLTSGITSIVFIVLMSFAHSLMWPSLWPLAIENLGKYTQLASAILIMGIAGGAIMPMLYGAWADAIGNRHLPYLILAPGYLFMIYFAVRGYKVGRSLPK